MKTQDIRKRAVWKIPLFVTAVFMLAVTFHACQQDEMMPEPEEIGLKEGLIPDISLIYPTVDVAAGADFDITYSASCGRIMIERGFILEVDVETGETTKVYGGLSCDMANLLWEAVGDDVFATCRGETITENLADPGTYVYRAKLNFKGKKNLDCPDCDFAGNQFECFMITVAAASSLETFTDTRDGKEYKIVTLGTQTWMAENLAYKDETTTGIYAYNNDEGNVATFGRLYTWDAAIASCPAGWHLPTADEWNTLFNYLIDNGYGFEGSGVDIAKALASPIGWDPSPQPGNPGNDPASNNSSGFSATPGGHREPAGYFWYLGQSAAWWTATKTSEHLAMTKELTYSYDQVYHNNYVSTGIAFSVRCVQNAE